MNRFCIVAGLILVLVGIAWPWLKLLPFGRLPGDIAIVRENFRLYFPVTTSVLVSLFLSLLLWLFRK